MNMDDIRKMIQTALSPQGEYDPEIEVGVPVPDDMIEDGVTYFGYTLSESYVDSDFDRNYTMQISLIGYLVRKNNSGENTLEIIDTALSYIKQALKSLHFNYSYDDVTISDNVRKIQVTATVKYNEINYWLV